MLHPAGRLVYLRGIFFFNLICFDVAVSTVWTKTRKHYMYTVYAYLICIVLSFGTFCNVFLNHSFFDFFFPCPVVLLGNLPFLPLHSSFPFFSFACLSFLSYTEPEAKWQNNYIQGCKEMTIMTKHDKKDTSRKLTNQWQKMTRFQGNDKRWQRHDKKWHCQEKEENCQNMTRLQEKAQKSQTNIKTWQVIRKMTRKITLSQKMTMF